jgi:carbamoyltransferase
MLILGLNAYHGDVAAVLLRDGELVAAIEEERFRRIKHCAGIPEHAMRACLEMGGVSAEQVDVFAVPRARRVHLPRKVLFALRHPRAARLARAHQSSAARLKALPDAIGDALELAPELVEARMQYVEHHPAHLASAFFASGFDEAAVCAIDGFGDFVSTSWGIGTGQRLEVTHRTFFPHSLGLLYLAVTQFLGFPHYGDEFKVMGLAPYGQPRFVDKLARLITFGPNGSFELALEYFRHWTGDVSMTWHDGEPRVETVWAPALESLLGPARRPGDPMHAAHEDLAASLQVLFEQAACHVLRAVHAQHPHDRLCLAGGCAMNSVANGKIRAATPFREIYVQPAAGDNGTALGAALHAWHIGQSGARRFTMQHGYWGTAYDDAAIAAMLDANPALSSQCRRSEVTGADLYRVAADHIADGRVVGWFQGRMEWGARALGNRSILADPRRADMRDIINRKIKFREKFRPFAPSILEEARDDYFVDAPRDPFMAQVYPIRPEKRGVIPAVTHVDGSGRLQTVARCSNPIYWQLIRAFADRTGVPVLLNTSFNENEPIVERPEQALDCFLRTDMDVLVMGHHILEKAAARA